jgi:hypothetical protein
MGKDGAFVPAKIHGSTIGRNDGSDSSDPKQSGNVTTQHYTAHQGSVVIRATVEHIGVVGDTEMTINVRWPASSFCTPCRDETSTGVGQGSAEETVPKNGPGAYILKASAPDTSVSAGSGKSHVETNTVNSGSQAGQQSGSSSVAESPAETHPHDVHNAQGTH